MVSARAGEIQDNYNQRKLYKYDDMCDDNEEDEEEGAQFDKRNEDTFEKYPKCFIIIIIIIIKLFTPSPYI